MDATTILAKTRELFAETHWTKKYLATTKDATGKQQFCAVGGIRYVTLSLLEDEEPDAAAALIDEIDPDVAPGEYRAAILALAEAAGIETEGDDGWESYERSLANIEDDIYGWNDDEKRTLDDVLFAFDEAARRVATRPSA